MRNNLFTNFVVPVVKPAMETIDFQDGSFGKELDSFFEKLLTKCKTKADVVKFADEDLFNSIVKKHTNISIKVDLKDDDEYASVYLPVINANHLFSDDTYLIKFSKLIADKYLPAFIQAIKDNDGKAGIDTKNGKVYGAFADIETKLCMPPSEILYHGLTPRELTATVMHEVGHLFNYYRYFSQAHKTNQVLSFISTSMTTDTPYVDRENILFKTMEVLGVSLNNVKELALECNIPKIILALSEQRDFFLHSELKSGMYDITANEQMADMYAARQGYAKELVTNLSKSVPWKNEKRSVLRAMSYLSLNKDILNSLGLLGLAATSIVVAAPVTTIAIIGAVSIGYVMSILYDSKTNKKDFTYDETLVRFKRIREQLVSYLKTDRNKEKVKIILTDIKEIDYLISILLPERTVFNMVADYLFSDSNHVRKTMVLQRHLEELASNDLFLGAAKLKHI